MIAFPSPHVFFCNAASKPVSIPNDAHITKLNYLPDAPRRLVNLKLPKFVDQFYHLPDRILDLLELAAYVFAADRATHRGAKDALEYNAWHRTMHFVMKVRDDKFWNQPQVKEHLSSALQFMTGDLEYSFDFIGGHTTPPTSLFDSEEFAITKRGAASVVLFSGGLDSLSGAAERLETTDEDLYLISHRSGHPSTKKTQNKLILALSDKYPGRVHHYSFDCGLANMRGAEETQRTRAFLFGSIAFAVAHRIDLDSFYAYENGVTSLNFIRRQDLMSARASRTTHPKTHALMSSFLSDVNNKPVKIINPFWSKTKADVFLNLEQFKGRDLIGSAVSCSKTFQTLGISTHCGCCFQCIDRRIAAYAAGLQDVDNSGIYSTDIFRNKIETDDTRTTALDYVRQAAEFSKESEDGFAMGRTAELSEVTPYLGMDEDVAVESTWNLCHRHGDQVMKALSEIRRHCEDLRFPLVEGSLLDIIATRAYLPNAQHKDVSGNGVKLDKINAHILDLKNIAVPLTGTVAKMEKDLKTISVIPKILDENKKTIQDQNERLAFLKQAITSSVRTTLEAVEQKIVKRKNDLCLRKLTEEELLLFLFLIGYRWKKEQKKVFSMRKICWVLGLSDPPHPEIVSRKQAELEKAYPSIKLLIAGYREINAKGEKRGKLKTISYDAMDNAERRGLGLDDTKEDDQ